MPEPRIENAVCSVGPFLEFNLISLIETDSHESCFALHHPRAEIVHLCMDCARLDSALRCDENEWGHASDCVNLVYDIFVSLRYWAVIPYSPLANT
jgi:hypothetical protein